MLRAPGNGLATPLDIADGDRELRTAESKVPAAEQTPPHQSRQRPFVAVHQRAGTDNPGHDPERGGFALDDFLLECLAPGVGAKLPRIVRARCAFVLTLPR